MPTLTYGITKGKPLSGAANATFDLKVIDVSGKVTLNGAVLPDDTQSRGEIEFASTEGNGAVSAALAPAGVGSYAAHLYAGTYDVRINSGSQQQKVLPQQRATLKKAQSFGASAGLDLDLSTANVSGAITADGAQLADDVQDRGTLVFVERTTGDRFDVAAGVAGPATYAVVLYAGTYGVEWTTSSANKSLPQQSTHVTDQKITGATKLDVALKTLSVSGAVKVNGQDMPNETGTGQSRGTVVFVDKLTGSRVVYDVGATGPASYSMRLFDGGYDVHFDASSSQTAVPEVDERVLSGCIPVSTACSLSDKDLSGSWLLDFSSWGTMELTLAQSGNALNGFADSSWGSGPLAAGTRTSSGVKFTATSGVDVYVTGDIANGCVMSGNAVASTGYVSDWVGQRLE